MDLHIIGITFEDGPSEQLEELKRLLATLKEGASDEDANTLRVMILCVEDQNDEGFDSLLTDLPKEMDAKIKGWLGI